MKRVKRMKRKKGMKRMREVERRLKTGEQRREEESSNEIKRVEMERRRERGVVERRIMKTFYDMMV